MLVKLTPEFITTLVAHRVPIVLNNTPLEDKAIEPLTDEIKVESVEENILVSCPEVSSEPDGVQLVEIKLEDEIKVEASQQEEVTEAVTCEVVASQVEITSNENPKVEIEDQTVRTLQIIRDT
jgi:hypothetical protein